MILRDVGCLLKLISINKPLRTNAQVQVCLNGCYGRILARGDGERGVGIVMLSQK